MQKLVDEAAKIAGYNIGPVYHGTLNDFDTFSFEKIGFRGTFPSPGFFFTTNKDFAEAGFATYDLKEGRVISAYLDIKKSVPHNSPMLTEQELIPIFERVNELSPYPDKIDVEERAKRAW